MDPGPPPPPGAGAGAGAPPAAYFVPPQYGQYDQLQGKQMPAMLIEYIARGLAILLTFLATLIVATSEEFGVKFSNYSAFMFFLVANILVLFYSIASLLLSIIIKSKSSVLRISNSIADLIAVSLLMAANGAAAAIIAQFDNIDHFDRRSACSSLTKFCPHVKASIAISMLAVALYLALTILTFLNFANKTY